MYKAYKFQLYPNDNQKVIISKTFGCIRNKHDINASINIMFKRLIIYYKN